MDESGKASEQSSITDPNVLVRGSGAGFSQEIIAGSHRLTADEPVAAGGTDIGPTPYDLLLAALGACTSMTVGMYARRKKWPLAGIVVRLRHSKIHADAVAFSLLVYSVAKFGKRGNDDGREPAQVYGGNQVELAWTMDTQ
jgi:organic hydroperoxide reductase OsmC/OhrA